MSEMNDERSICIETGGFADYLGVHDLFSFLIFFLTTSARLYYTL